MSNKSNKKLSQSIEELSSTNREIAEGYRESRNILGVGLGGTTLLLNALEGVRAMPTIDQLKFNAAGLAIAGLSALGMEYHRQRSLELSESRADLAEELASLDL